MPPPAGRRGQLSKDLGTAAWGRRFDDVTPAPGRRPEVSLYFRPSILSGLLEAEVNGVYRELLYGARIQTTARVRLGAAAVLLSGSRGSAPQCSTIAELRGREGQPAMRGSGGSQFRPILCTLDSKGARIVSKFVTLGTVPTPYVVVYVGD